jgi:hypothetical protein
MFKKHSNANLIRSSFEDRVNQRVAKLEASAKKLECAGSKQNRSLALHYANKAAGLVEAKNILNVIYAQIGTGK